MFFSGGLLCITVVRVGLDQNCFVFLLFPGSAPASHSFYNVLKKLRMVYLSIREFICGYNCEAHHVSFMSSLDPLSLENEND